MHDHGPATAMQLLLACMHAKHHLQWSNLEVISAQTWRKIQQLHAGKESEERCQPLPAFAPGIQGQRLHPSRGRTRHCVQRQRFHLFVI